MSLVDEKEKPLVFAFIKGNLTDKDRSHTRTREFADWPSLKTFLVESFSDRRAHGQYQLELNTCRQRPGENVSNYANRIEELLLKLGESLDKELSAVEKNFYKIRL